MIDYRNPYTPGAGVMPKYLAGRDALLADAEKRLQAISTGYQTRSLVYYGLRGVGKTVVLNRVESAAESLNMLVRHIEVQERRDFVKALAMACSAFVLNLSTRESLRDKVSRLLSVIKSFSARWNPEDNTLSFELGDRAFEAATAGTGDLANDLTELLVSLGKYAQLARASICFCIDEVQYAKNSELDALMTALHRSNQLGLPIIFFCAGLPKILKSMGDAKSYSERLFEFIEVDSLSEPEARAAICMPAERLRVAYSEEAIRLIIGYTEGYPYFIQELCNTIWDTGSDILVDDALVKHCLPLTEQKLDAGFFNVRYKRCTPREQDFLAAMVACGDLPCTIVNVATNMNSTVPSISPIRANLISKGLIYSTGRGEIDFTVPQFDTFIRRVCQNC